MIAPELLVLVVILVCCFAATLVTTPLAIFGAHRLGMVDAPDGRRKHQTKPVPVVGGLAVLVGLAFAVGLLCLCDGSIRWLIFSDPQTTSLLIAIALLATIGIIDDTRGLRGRHKLIGQLVAVSVLIHGGQLNVEQISMFGLPIHLGPLNSLFVILWLLGIINAINLIDGMDGLLGSIGVIVCLTFAVIAGIVGQWYVALLATALAGGLLGFLVYNLPPAKVYLGDCGSMVIGLIIGAMSLRGSLKGPTGLVLSIPLALLILPLFDTTAAIARRKLTGRSIYSTDRGHLHHCLLRSGYNRPKALLLVVLLSLTTAAGAIASIIWNSDWFAITSAFAVLGVLVVGRLFGHAELKLVFRRFAKVFATLNRSQHNLDGHTLDAHLQGHIPWNDLWDDLTERAKSLELQMIALDVNAPALHENYHARWDRLRDSETESQGDWRTELPIRLDQQVIGRLSVIGRPSAAGMSDKLAALAVLLEQLESEVLRLTRISPVPPAESVSGRENPLVPMGVG